MNKQFKYKVLGSPIDHSLSPMIHKKFATELNIDIQYSKEEVTKSQLSQVIQRLISEDYAGVNLTSPLKEEGLKLCNTLTKRAINAKAINTMVFTDGNILGDITDGLGFIKSIQNIKGNFFNKILILGSGGVIRAIIQEIPSDCNIYICNRTKIKADEIAQDFLNVKVIDSEEIGQYSYDMVINGTTNTELNYFEKVSHEAKLYYDLQYNDKSSFKKWCEGNRLNYKSGLAMLINQAAESFYLWQGKMPNTDIKHIL